MKITSNQENLDFVVHKIYSIDNIICKSQVKILFYNLRGISHLGPSVRPIPLLINTCSKAYSLLYLRYTWITEEEGGELTDYGIRSSLNQ